MTEEPDRQLPVMNSSQRAQKLADDFMRVADQVHSAKIKCGEAMERFVDLYDAESASNLHDEINRLEAAIAAMTEAKCEYDMKHGLSVAAIDMKYAAIAAECDYMHLHLQSKLDEYYSSKHGVAAPPDDAHLPSPAMPLPLSLIQAANLWAFGDHEQAHDELSPQDEDLLAIVQQRLLTSLEARYVTAEGNLGSQWYQGGDPWDGGWQGHAVAATVIPAGAWKVGRVNWGRSTLITHEGEYIAVRLSEAAVLDLITWWAQRSTSAVPAAPFDDTPTAPAVVPPTVPAYLDPTHPHHSRKLAAAIAAWEAVHADPSLLRKRRERQALKAWLTQNAATLGLMKPDGTVNETGVEEVSKVANWDHNGGPARTSD